MVDYDVLDPCTRSGFDHGIDAKIVVMGNTGVGKTSLLYRYTQNKYDPRTMTSTTGAFFVTKKVAMDGRKVRLQLWDTAGQERFRSMAPMYYRGANAALLLYDITSAATFDDIKGWLEELKKNCSSELIIYIVGSKADLHHQRQVTSDLARLSLHNWFPPSPPPSPPASPPAPAPSTLSYMRPRFTSFTSIRSAPLNSTPSSPPHSASYLDPAVKDTPVRHCSTGVAISRSKTSLPSKPKAVALHRSHTLTDPPRSHRSRYWSSAFHNDPGESSSNSIAEDDETEDDQQWGVCKGMELFEVSAKDDLGIQTLFDSLIAAIIERRHIIERENDLRKRGRVFPSSTSTPTWAAQAEEEEAGEKARASAGWSCCSS